MSCKDLYGSQLIQRLSNWQCSCIFSYMFYLFIIFSYMLYVYCQVFCFFITSCISVRIRNIDAVIITHSHADAIGGLWQNTFWCYLMDNEWTCDNRSSYFFSFYFSISILFKLEKTNKFVTEVSLFLFSPPSFQKKNHPGLDDLRDWTNNVQPCIPIYVAPRDFEVQLLLLLHHFQYSINLYWALFEIHLWLNTENCFS